MNMITYVKTTESIIMKPGRVHLKSELHLQVEECLRMRLYNTCRGVNTRLPHTQSFRKIAVYIRRCII